MHFNGDTCAITGNGNTAVNFDKKWNISVVGEAAEDNVVHMVVNTSTGAGYCYVNGELAAYTQNLQTDGSWAGYSIYTAGTWDEGSYYKWIYNVDKNVGYTWYQDTESHTVTLEDVLEHNGLAQSGGFTTPFSGANYSVGGGDIKGAIKTGTVWTRTHGGSSDAVRTTCKMAVNSGQSAGNGTQIIQGYTNVSASDAKFVHARFRVNCTSGWGIRIRQADNSNTQWMVFDKDGAVSGNGGTAVNLGTAWNVSTSDNTVVNDIDMVVNPNTGAGYCFVNGMLASYTQNLQTDGTWKGYLIYTSGTWNGGDNLYWQYDNDLGESGKGSSYTKYVDSEIHTVTIEEVLNHKGLAPSNGGDNSLIFSNSDVADYITSVNSATLSYSSQDSVTVSGDYYSASTGNANPFAYFFSGNGYKLETEMGGSLLYVSYTQQIANASRVEVRLRAGGSNQNNNRFTFTPDDGKFHANGFSGAGSTLNKAWDAAVNIGILIDKSNHKAYSFVDGKQLGGAFDFSDKGDFNDIRLYLNGTEDNSVSSVTLSNWSLKQYDSSKDREALLEEITGKNIEIIDYTFRDGQNGLLTDLADATTVVAKVDFRVNTAVSQSLDVYLAVYSESGALKNIVKNSATLTQSNNSVTVTLNTEPLEGTDSCRLYFWGTNSMSPVFDSVAYVSSAYKPVKILALGNSFSKDSTTMIREIAAADNVNVETYNAYQAGKTLPGHYNAWNSGTEEYRIEKEGISTGNYQTLQEFVTMDDWDYIVLQGATHFNCYDAGLWNVDPAATQNYWTTLKNGINSLAPGAKRLVHATWAPIDELSARVNNGMFENGSPDARGAYLKALLPNEQIGANIFSTETAANGQKEYIPTAVAIDYLVRHYNFPEYIGDLDNSVDDAYDNSSTTRAIYRDKTCHLTNNVGKVLAGLVWYEMITGKSAVDNGYERSTLSAADMAKLKEAAHYACLNYMTYDPETVFSEDETEPVSASAMKVKNGAKAIVSFIHDDGSTPTVEFLAREVEKNNMNATVALWGNRLSDSTYNTWKNLFDAGHGRLGFASHSYSHEYLGETDNGESGTLSDGTEFAYPAGHMTAEIANERARINSYFPDERVLTFIKPGTSYPSGKPQVSNAARAMIEEHYIAMRNTGGGLETIPPSNYYSVKSYMAEKTDEPSKWIAYLEQAYNNDGMIVYLFHTIVDTESSWSLSTMQSDVSVLLDEIGDYVSDNRVWSAKFEEAIQYCREYSALTKVEALNVPTQNKITVEVRDNISKIDHDITTGKYAGRDMYDYPITVKTQIPYNWNYVKMTQSYDSRMEIVKTFTENGVRYAYVNVVPDQAAAILTEAATSEYVSSILVGGSTISGFDPAKFYYKLILPSGTSSAPAVTCDKNGATVINATLDDGEGSAFITFNGLKYEIHFSVE